jgi:hypothetical protein
VVFSRASPASDGNGRNTFRLYLSNREITNSESLSDLAGLHDEQWGLAAVINETQLAAAAFAGFQYQFK